MSASSSGETHPIVVSEESCCINVSSTYGGKLLSGLVSGLAIPAGKISCECAAFEEPVDELTVVGPNTFVSANHVKKHLDHNSVSKPWGLPHSNQILAFY